jgi:ribosome biogenesis GTPase / thiamine phosphate phosphatase
VGGADPQWGRVVALQANFCLVALDRPGPAGEDRLLCTRRSRLGKSGLQVCAGDRVEVEGIDWTCGRGVVGALAPRRNRLQRPAVANVSRVVVVAALSEPRLDPLQLTRFLITAEAIAQPVLLVLAKVDLLPALEVAAWCDRLRRWGYPVQPVSSRSGEGLEDLRRLLADPGIAVLCGPSGVGKSSLLNALAPDLQLRIGSVSGRLQRGRHTTRHVELFALGGGALVADTPGFNRPSLPNDATVLAMAFPELRRRLGEGRCRFGDCLHLGDPGCAVGTEWERHPLYRQCLVELLATGEGPGAANTARGRLPKGSLKDRGGRLEPRLDPDLRGSSRRRQRQDLQEELEAAERGISPPDRAD